MIADDLQENLRRTSEDDLVASYLLDREVVAWFSLTLVHHTSQRFGREFGPIVHVRYLTITERWRGDLDLMRFLVCRLIRTTITFGQERARAVAIDPDHTSPSVGRALSRRPEAVGTQDYPWPYVVTMPLLPRLANRYCDAAG